MKIIQGKRKAIFLKDIGVNVQEFLLKFKCNNINDIKKMRIDLNELTPKTI